MTKIEMRRLVDKYGMELARDPITGEATRFWLDSEELIPELDALADSTEMTIAPVMRSQMGGTYRYTMAIPTGWVTLSGWADEE